MGQSDIIRTIEVTGEFKQKFTPDEIIFSISIEEYWEEEFQKGKEYEDYRTKVEITTIETALIEELTKMDISMDMITLNRTGNNWRQRGKDFLISKTIDIKLRSFAKANNISNTLSTRGIRSMSIKQLKLDNQAEEELLAKSKALKIAKQKAETIAAAVGKSIKDVVSIVEVDGYVGINPRSYAKSNNAMLRSADSGGAQYDNFKKIEIKAAVRVVWELQ